MLILATTAYGAPWFYPDSIDANAFQEVEIQEAFAVLEGLLSDEDFLSYLEGRWLLTVRDRKEPVDMLHYVELLRTACVRSPWSPGYFRTYALSVRSQTATSAAKARMHLSRRHRGLQADTRGTPGWVHGSLVNTLLHEHSHLLIDPRSDPPRSWITDHRDDALFRSQAASYQIGVSAECYLYWSAGIVGSMRACVTNVDDAGNLRLESQLIDMGRWR